MFQKVVGVGPQGLEQRQQLQLCEDTLDIICMFSLYPWRKYIISGCLKSSQWEEMVHFRNMNNYNVLWPKWALWCLIIISKKKKKKLLSNGAEEAGTDSIIICSCGNPLWFLARNKRFYCLCLMDSWIVSEYLLICITILEVNLTFKLAIGRIIGCIWNSKTLHPTEVMTSVNKLHNAQAIYRYQSLAMWSWPVFK